MFASRRIAAAPIQAAAVQRRCATQAADPWPGLESWRGSGIDGRRVWGLKLAEQGHAESWEACQDVPLASTLADCAAQVLTTADPMQKAALTHRAWQQFCAGSMSVGVAQPSDRPARPEVPQLVIPREVPTPKQTPLPLNVYTLHNLAHVELNAIDLAWDTVARFSQMGLPQAFYTDFARVADDESRHFGWCQQRLKELGFSYGCMVAHSILWDGAVASSGDLPGRLAVVPMSQEARGLDAGPRLQGRLVGWGDNRSAAIVGRIAAEERAHVAVGVTWFKHICAALGREPGQAYQQSLLQLGQEEALRPPYNDSARIEVGLQRHWYDRGLWECLKQPAAQQPPDTMPLEQLRQRLAAVLAVEGEAAF